VKTGEDFAEIHPQRIELGEQPVSRTLTLKNVTPTLWTPAEPHLYRLDVTLESESGVVLDAWTRNVGFRTFEARGSRLLLNGKPYWLRGANHLPYGKNPFDPELPRKLIQLLHDANIRVTRTHATPWNEAWLDAADELGLGVSLEGIRPWALCGKVGATPPELFAHWLIENEDVVKRARNHPSVLIYTVGNEMLLRDNRNLEKWQQLSDVVKQTRRLDPARPVICSSEYARDPDLYESLLKPNGIDDGDLDDIHRYNNWYAPSSFVTDATFEKELQINGGRRPFIGQEMSTGYPDLDSGLPVLRYTRDLLTPQAWVGQHAYPGSDAAIFLEHHRAVTKRWAERLRFERGGSTLHAMGNAGGVLPQGTAGFMLFATECWFAHSFDAKRVKAYPVVESVREAFAPMGLALETGRRRFFAGETVETAVFITNDDEQFRDHNQLRLELVVEDAVTGRSLQTVALGGVTRLSYGETARLAVRFELPPATAGRRAVRLSFRLHASQAELSRTTEPVEIFARSNPARTRLAATAVLQAIGPRVRQLAEGQFANTVAELPAVGAPHATVILAGGTVAPQEFAAGGRLRAAVEGGATAVWFAPGRRVIEAFPEDVLSVSSREAEFADWTPIRGTPLAEGLQPMDLKWWGRAEDGRVFVAAESHRLAPGSRARELLRHVPAHGYIAADKVPEQYRTVLFELSLGKGRLWVCDLDLETSGAVDPAARLFAGNLLRAAADPQSTRHLPSVPSHEASLRASP
jgi:hypothetical protein